jgi:hypothetical protein
MLVNDWMKNAKDSSFATELYRLRTVRFIQYPSSGKGWHQARILLTCVSHYLCAMTLHLHTYATASAGLSWLPSVFRCAAERAVLSQNFNKVCECNTKLVETSKCPPHGPAAQEHFLNGVYFRFICCLVQFLLTSMELWLFTLNQSHNYSWSWHTLQ